jgi:hypothetical protein
VSRPGRGYYRLDENGAPVEVADALDWARSFETADRHVALDVLPDGVKISTVFLGLDHSFGEGPPVLWETMIFGGPHADYQRRYTSRAEAVAGHAHALRLAKGETIDDPTA